MMKIHKYNQYIYISLYTYTIIWSVKRKTVVTPVLDGVIAVVAKQSPHLSFALNFWNAHH